MAHCSGRFPSARFLWAFALTARTSGWPTPIRTTSRNSAPATAPCSRLIPSAMPLAPSFSMEQTPGSPTLLTTRSPCCKPAMARRSARFPSATLRKISPSTAQMCGCRTPPETLCLSYERTGRPRGRSTTCRFAARRWLNFAKQVRRAGLIWKLESIRNNLLAGLRIHERLHGSRGGDAFTRELLAVGRERIRDHEPRVHQQAKAGDTGDFRGTVLNDAI